MGKPKRQDDKRSVGREEFLKNPAAVVQRAKAEGTISITDGNGKARVLICIPTDVRPEPLR